MPSTDPKPTVNGSTSGVNGGRGRRRSRRSSESVPEPPAEAPAVVAPAAAPAAQPSGDGKIWSADGKWYIGQRIEACDIHRKWYSAKICQFGDEELEEGEHKGQMRVHFLRWSNRYDQWIRTDSDLVRKIPDDKASTAMDVELEDRVLAKWKDGNMYPARVVKLVGRFCHVVFDDGIRTKLPINVLQPLPADYSGEAVPPKAPKPSGTFSIDPTGNHNKYICEKCDKGFRKESLLSSHIKHYHNQDDDGGSGPPLDSPAPSSGAGGSSGYETRIRERRERRHRQASKEETGGSAAPSVSGTSTPEPAVTKPVPGKVVDESQGEGNDLKLRLNLAALMEAGGSSSEDTVINEIYVEREMETPATAAASISSTSTVATTTSTPTSTTGKKKRGGDRRSHTSANNLLHGKGGGNNSGSSGVGNSKRAKPEDGGYPYYYGCPPALWKKPKGNNAVSYFDARKTRDEHENDNIEEVVKCICSYHEENGLMVQCELCLTWQHALCMGYKHESDVPSDGYFCPFCRSPAKPSKTQRGCHQLNHWLKAALEPGFTPSHFRTRTEEEADEKARREARKQEESFESTLHDEFDLNPSLSSAVDAVQDPLLSDPMMTDTISTADTVPVAAERRKSYLINDFGDVQQQQQSTNRECLMEDVMENLGFSQAPAPPSESEVFARHVKATNQLATVMHDVVRLLNTLDYRIRNESSPEAIAQIKEKQRKCADFLELVDSKLTQLEDEVERRELEANQLSSSTISAPSSPINLGKESEPDSAATTTSKKEEPATTTVPVASTPTVMKPMPMVAADPTNSALYQALNSPTKMTSKTFMSVGGTPNASTSMPPPPTPPPKVSTMMSSSTTFKPMETISSPLTSSPLGIGMQASSSGGGLPPQGPMASPTTTSTARGAPQYPPDVLARLLLSRLPKSDGTEPTEQEEAKLESQLLDQCLIRPSMTHDYLFLHPNRKESEFMIEFDYHFDDLEVARKIVLSI